MRDGGFGSKGFPGAFGSQREPKEKPPLNSQGPGHAGCWAYEFDGFRRVSKLGSGWLFSLNPLNGHDFGNTNSGPRVKQSKPDRPGIPLGFLIVGKF